MPLASGGSIPALGRVADKKGECTAKAEGGIIAAMANSPSPTGSDEWLRRYQVSRSSEGDQAKSQPYLGIHSILVYVRDQDESLKFYIEKLGFQLVADAP